MPLLSYGSTRAGGAARFGVVMAFEGAHVQIAEPAQPRGAS